MIHVVIDSSIYRRDPRRVKAAFTALERLAVAGLVKIHIPRVVFKEFVSQQEAEYATHLKKVEDALRSLQAMLLRDGAVADAQAITSQADAPKRHIDGYAAEEFTAWAGRVSATIHPITSGHGKAVMDDYFRGAPPFKVAKNRQDIPDSFIWRTVLDLKGAHGELSVIVGDRAVREACNSATGVTSYDSLEDFLKSPRCQQLIKKESTDRLTGILTLVLDRQSGLVNQAIEDALIDLLPGKTVTSDSIPDDNHEAIISTLENTDYIGVERHQLQYLGDGTFLVPFAVRVDCLLDYFIFIADYYALGDDRTASIGTSSWNDHNYAAEETYTLVVEGLVSINLGADVGQGEITEDGVASLLTPDAISIDSIEEISVEED